MSSPSPSQSLDAPRPGLVLTAVGPDRKGLVNAIASLVNRAGGNIEDTRMAKLGGEFAVLLFVTGSEAALAAVEAQKDELVEALGVACFFKRTFADRGTLGALPYTLSVSALDRPGIVESVSEALLRFHVNVRSLTSRLVHAPLSGTPLFQLEAELEVPTTVNLADFRRELESAAERENLDHQLTPGAS